MGGLTKEVDVERYALEILLENPSLSIDSVVRQVDHAYHIGIAKEKIARLRRKVQDMIGRGHGGPQERLAPPEHEPEPFNPPRLVPKMEEEPAMVEAEQQQAASTPEERRSWFSTWALDHPDSTVEAARRALSERFGMAIGTKAIVEILGDARRIHAENTNPSASTDTPTAKVMQTTNNPAVDIRELVACAKRLGIRKLEIHDDNYVIEMEGRM
jgi:hypothetical protein